MLWFRSKKDATIDQLVAKLADAQLELTIERGKASIATELATSFKVRAEKAEEYAARAEASRDEMMKMYSASLSATTEKLLDHHISPEGPMPDPKSFTAMLGNNQKRVPAVRKHFKDAQIAAMRPHVKPPVLEPRLNSDGKPTLGLREGMDALNLDNLIH